MYLFETPAFAVKKSYVVYLGSHSHAPDAQLSEADLHAVTNSHHQFLGSFLGSTEEARHAIFYSYQRHINGFSALLEEEVAAEIAKHPKVVSVFLNQARKLHTTRSWEFMLLEKNGVIHPSSLWKKARFGEDVIIANLDTGVWPESKSFSDEGYGPIPSRWKGTCQNDTTFSCNRKLIGARHFNKGFLTAHQLPLSPFYNTTRDYIGHGTHTLSTAAGNFVPGTTVFSVGNGTAKGGAPKARVATYKICWPPVREHKGGCYDSDIVAAFEAAIHDGVDVISLSVGGGPKNYFSDGIAIGSFHAIQKGIVVVCSAGNDGPQSGTVANIAPWLFTVGASTIGRQFPNVVELGNGLRLKGSSISEPLPEDRLYPLISSLQAKAANASALDAEQCLAGSLDPAKVKGKILACLRGGSDRMEKGQQAALAGAVGFILSNDKSFGDEISQDLHMLPASHINYRDGLALYSYINSTDDPVAFITPTSEMLAGPAPFMADFSSVGPNIITPEILKVCGPNQKVLAMKVTDPYLQGGKGHARMTPPSLVTGHGTHTLSTAAGNFVPGTTVFSVGNGTAKGGAPKARVATYKICWPPVREHKGGCYDSDIVAAFEAAIHDGVDVISLSVGGGPKNYFSDGIAIGSFHAIQKGIVVVCSAGNDGPQSGTVANIAPWLFTVGASTIGRQFPNVVELGNGLRLKGSSISEPLPEDRLYPLISSLQAKAANASALDAEQCLAGSLDPAKVKGKILACLRGGSDRMEKGQQAALAGAVGFILSNDKSFGDEISQDLHMLPASHINYRDGLALYSYINSTDDPVAFITPTSEMLAGPAPFMADFSSVGPNIITPEILKPDVTAPGVNIIAAFSEAASPSESYFDKRRTAFNLNSGTSMSCPHVAGVVALLKTLYPYWSPAAIRSAIMTTARTRDNTIHPMRDGYSKKATPFHYGSGHMRPNRAMNPGLVYDLSVNDYLDFLCAIGYNQTLIHAFSVGHKCPKSASLLEFNYPSIAVLKLSGSVTVSRKLKNVGSPGKYAVRIKEPYGISVSVEPRVLTFDKNGEEKSFKATFTAKWEGAAKEYEFGGLIWTDGLHYVRSPIVVSAA
ncbi:hypothetical protein JCGZ_16424 [Jatropha curcas]|uniref:Uncharacterized protein n=1 Tax=Jatropha curcas TaxID=180498 RepID=A0A067K9R3_JATCU|nr:hypothetical protein JCGZ_16424 [Jatropha curcas]